MWEENPLNQKVQAIIIMGGLTVVTVSLGIASIIYPALFPYFLFSLSLILGFVLVWAIGAIGLFIFYKLVRDKNKNQN